MKYENIPPAQKGKNKTYCEMLQMKQFLQKGRGRGNN